MMAGWDGPNRKKRQRSKSIVCEAIAPTQSLTGGWFAARELRCGLSITTCKKYLEDMADRGELERQVIAGKYRYYRLPEVQR